MSYFLPEAGLIGSDDAFDAGAGAVLPFLSAFGLRTSLLLRICPLAMASSIPGRNLPAIYLERPVVECKA